MKVDADLKKGEQESCGCQWYRGRIERDGVVITGDHLVECEGHRNGTAPPLPGSEPDGDSFERLLDALHAGGIDTCVADELRGVAGRRPFDD
jgi:hypothetical protein